eukprot:CAMPEP_0168611340 /NCGR_PEP_ID=MMETSP0449_2-20121227/2307_1 /TAXON_ID=1082188 /ORGANISM="Strombidium rassoulzadegani, Strain ras09" /LENGTH=60 /DNA_ID=CAMNT_0008651783 /DNA_START=796 /DNA_END=975 /DNA_ORIENTATION=-
MTRSQAAEMIGVSKKSLDDYAMFVRYGVRFGFDFKAYGKETVGFLRQFSLTERDRRAGEE